MQGDPPKWGAARGDLYSPPVLHARAPGPGKLGGSVRDGRGRTVQRPSAPPCPPRGDGPVGWKDLWPRSPGFGGGGVAEAGAIGLPWGGDCKAAPPLLPGGTPALSSHPPAWSPEFKRPNPRRGIQNQPPPFLHPLIVCFTLQPGIQSFCKHLPSIAGYFEGDVACSPGHSCTQQGPLLLCLSPSSGK